MGVHAAFIHLDSQVQASLKRRPRRLRTGCPARGGERITGVGGDAGAMEQGQGTQGGIPAGAEETGHNHSIRHWDFPGKNTGVGCHFLLWGIFPTQGLNPHLVSPPLQVDSLPAEPSGKPTLWQKCSFSFVTVRPLQFWRKIFEKNRHICQK